jgi:signal transduction histidine kinase
LSALPIGVCLFGMDGRKLTATRAFYDILGLPTNTLRDGTSLFDAFLVLAHHGVMGPGAPERQAQSLLAADRGQTQRIRHRRQDGHSLELQIAGLADGRLLLTVADQTGLVSRRRQAETQARHMIEMFETLPIGIAVLDTTRTLRLANRRFTELLACPPNMLPIGMTLEQFSAQLKENSVDVALSETYLPWQALELALEPETNTSSHLTLETGERVAVVGRHLPAGGWVVTASPLAESAPDHATLQRRQSLVDQTLQSLPHGVCIYGPDRRLRLVNRAFLDLGWSRDAEIGDSFDMSPIAQGGSDAAPIDPGRPHFLRRYSANGTPLDVRLIPLADAGFACIATDITAFAGQDLTPVPASDRMLQNLPHGVLLWDERHCLTAWNPRAAALLEVAPGLLRLGLPHAELLTELASQGVFGGVEETGPRLADLLGRDRRTSHVHRRGNRTGRVLEVRSDPIDEGGFVVTYTDVTDYRRAEEALRREREAAEAASSAKSQFLATMSHELRTPLNAVIGYSEALAREANDRFGAEREGDFAKRAAEFAGTINQAGHDLLGFINNILDVARIESGRFELATDRIEVTNLINVCVRQASAEARTAEVSIWVDIAKDLPVLHGDERRLRQVLLHILSNAVAFTRPGGTVRVGASLSNDGDLLIRVVDSGIGIAEGDQARVFEPFVHLDSSLSRRARGAGLGLYVARALMTEHGGEVGLTSAPGAGTTITLRLPSNRFVR